MTEPIGNLGELSNGPIPDRHASTNPKLAVEKYPLQIAVKWFEVYEISIEHVW